MDEERKYRALQQRLVEQGKVWRDEWEANVGCHDPATWPRCSGPPSNRSDVVAYGDHQVVADEDGLRCVRCGKRV